MAISKYIRFAVLFLIPSISFADDWTNTDIGLETAYTVVHVMDWGQTLSMTETQYHETNRILGDYPSRRKINTYFASTLLLHVAIAQVLPSKWRSTWQLVTIGVEFGTVAKNAKLGIKVKF